VGTAKRERQKANRKLRLEELAKEARKQKSKRVFLRVGAVVAAVVVLVGAISLFGGDDEEATTTTSTSVTLPAVPVAPALPEPTPPAELPTELVVTPITAGTGAPTVAGDTVEVFYNGFLSADGTVFDENYSSGQPFPVTIGETSVIDGWTQGLVGVQLGGRYQLDIPAALAYGDTGSGEIIKPGDAISFIVDIAAVTAAADGVRNVAPSMTTLPGATTTTAAPADPVITEFAYGTGECPEADGSSEKVSTFTEAPKLCIDPSKQYTATFETSKGTIVVELDMSVPGTVNNFVTLARYHYYDDTIIFRTDPSIDIIQGGGMTNEDSPGYTIPDEGTGFTYAAGKLAMARTGAPNSAGGQWFFVAGPLASALDSQGTYVNFGDVTEGLDVVQAILALVGDDGQTPSEEVQLISVTITEA